MSQDRSVTAWIDGLKSGDSAAAGEIWQRYIDRLVRLARAKLGSSPRRVSDEEDVALSAFNDFLQGVQQNRFARLDDRDDLWQILVVITERKAMGQQRHERAQKRGGGQVRGESVFAAAEADNSQQPGLAQWADREPTPAFAVQMTEEMRRALDSLGDDVQREVAIGKLAGYTNKELADRLGISLRAVERKLSIIRRKWDAESQS
ncbi:MAG: RNA polymerase subunit sigma-70 [Planctomycetaceae bacterium]|mgnify:CR=1 FL=1|nr:RNA polymerase subunit sigma-70 [Planctomycetaceae bacterium]